MVTYLYWFLVFGLMFVAVCVVGGVFRQWVVSLGLAALIGIVGTLAYYFHYQQVFVKRWGGIMSITVPDGHHHMGVTWKDDHLWVENYDPATNTCEFREYSRGDLLQGKVILKNCNPLKKP